MTETATCGVCKHPGEPLFQQRDLLCGLPGEFGQRRCPCCDSYFLSPRVPESHIAAYYPTSYAPYAPASNSILDKAGSLLGLTRYRQRLVEKYASHGAILDVGAGNGSFLRALSGTSWDRYALDVEQYCEFDFPVTFTSGRFDQTPPAFPPMAVITMWHVFEHFYHPSMALANAAQLLTPGGYLFLAIPDPQCVERRIFGSNWIGWDAPRHIATYSAKAMEIQLARAGLQLIHIHPDLCSGGLLALNFEFALRARGVQLDVHTTIPARLLASPLAMLSSLGGLAPAKVYVARK